MDYKKDQVFASISLHYGSFKETAEEFGFTDAATLIINQAKTKKLGSLKLRLMLGKNVRVSASAEDDRFVISVDGTPEGLEQGSNLPISY